MKSVYNSAMILADDQAPTFGIGHEGNLHINLDELKRWSKQVRNRTVRTVAVNLIESLMTLWDQNIIDKWSFYQICTELLRRRWITITKIAEVSGVEADVISMRLACLRAM